MDGMFLVIVHGFRLPANCYQTAAKHGRISSDSHRQDGVLRKGGGAGGKRSIGAVHLMPLVECRSRPKGSQRQKINCGLRRPTASILPPAMPWLQLGVYMCSLDAHPFSDAPRVPPAPSC